MREISIVVVTAWVLICTSCGNPDQASTAGSPSAAPMEPGAVIYKQYCSACHGPDGKLGFSDAADLSASTLSMEERIAVITHGRKAMIAYEDILSKQEIELVAEYIATLTK